MALVVSENNPADRPRSTNMSSSSPHPGVQNSIVRDQVELQKRIREMERQLKDLTAKERAHLCAKQRDARGFIHRGDTEMLVVQEPPDKFDGPCALSKMEGVYTFIEPGEFQLRRGDTVRAKILDVGPSHAEAIALSIESTGNQE